jgi:hypothetical protein
MSLIDLHGYPKSEILQHGNSDALCDGRRVSGLHDTFALPGKRM